MLPYLLLVLAAPPQFCAAPLDLAGVPLAEAEALAGRLVVIPPGNLGAWDRWDDWDVYAVAGDGDSERGVFVPEGMDVRDRQWAVGCWRCGCD